MRGLMLVMMVVFLFIGCSDTKVIDGVEYDTYGLFNEGSMKNPNIEYRVVPGNVVWSIILFETIIAPVYFIGYDMYEPVAKKDSTFIKGRVYR